MITLTTPFLLPSALGNSSGTSYDKFDVILVTFDVLNSTIGGTCQVISSGTPAAPPITGTFNISAGVTPTLSLSINLAFVTPTVITLNGAQKTALLTGLVNAQGGIENAMIGTGGVVGTFTPGL